MMQAGGCIEWLEESGSFSICALPARGIARASRNNIVGELSYGSYPAAIRSEPAPKDIIPRRR